MEAGIESWDYLKRRLAELGLLDRVYPHQSQLPPHLRRRPHRRRLPRRRLVSLRHPEVLERIIQEHLIGGQVVEEFCFARSGVA